MNLELLYRITELSLMEIEEVVDIVYDAENSNSAKLILFGGEEYILSLLKV